MSTGVAPLWCNPIGILLLTERPLQELLMIQRSLRPQLGCPQHLIRPWAMGNVKMEVANVPMLTQKRRSQMMLHVDPNATVMPYA
jgi:hypothetical protein